MLLIGTKNIGTQTVLADGIINIGSVYRKYCKKNAIYGIISLDNNVRILF